VFKSVLRKLRGVLGTSVTWALSWSVGGTALQAILSAFGILVPPNMPTALVGWGIMGCVGGSLFGTVLSIAEGRNVLERLGPGRVAVWGALAGLAFPFVSDVIRPGSHSLILLYSLPSAILVPVLSAISAAGMIALAKKYAPPELESGDLDGLLSDGRDS
jgi:hypothetical protein